MTERGNDCRRISRRAAIAGTAFALGAGVALPVRQAAAQQKISQSIAKYQGMPHGDQHCEACGNYQPPNGCKFVEGEINPNGWCQLFSPKA